jgi:glycosyltransferase involved in cell wall biosynthesis
VRARSFCIYPPPAKQYAGPATFAGHLKNHLESHGFAYRDTIDADLGVLIVFVSAPFSLLRNARRLGVPVILRLDGAYYRRKHGWFHKEYLRTNLRMWAIRRFLCDAIVYQSRYSWRMLDALLGRSPKPARVIHNGISLPPAAAPALPGMPGASGAHPLRFAATGRFRGDDMLPSTVRALDLAAGEFPFTLDVYGSVGEPWKPWLARPWINAMGKRPNEEVRAGLPRYDALIFTQTSPSCPNVVIEAVTAGLPVIAYATGSVPELLTFNQELLAATPDRLMHGTADFDPAALAECLRRFRAGREGFRAEAERHRADFPEEGTLGGYRRLLEELMAGEP